VSVADDGVPKAGVTRVGELALTTLPVPVGVLAQLAVKVPVVVTGEPVTVRSLGKDNPTEDTVSPHFTS